MKKSLVTLALAGSLSASQFLGNVKSFIPDITPQELNKQKIALKNQKSRTLTNEQIKVLEESINIMFGVNERTFSDFFPTLEISLQKWVKEDAKSVYAAMDIMDEFLNLRLKQYANMKTMLKGKNSSKDLLGKIKEMEKLSMEAKKNVKKYREEIEIISSIKEALLGVQDVPILDFWLPTLAKSNSVIVKLMGIDDDDYESMDRYEALLNDRINSKYIDTVMVG